MAELEGRAACRVRMVECQIRRPGVKSLEASFGRMASKTAPKDVLIECSVARTGDYKRLPHAADPALLKADFQEACCFKPLRLAPSLQILRAELTALTTATQKLQDSVQVTGGRLAGKAAENFIKSAKQAESQQQSANEWSQDQCRHQDSAPDSAENQISDDEDEARPDHQKEPPPRCKPDHRLADEELSSFGLKLGGHESAELSSISESRENCQLP